jgi:hypothetical protein
VTFCLCCGGAGFAGQAGVAGGSLSYGYVVEVCVGVNTFPFLQVGVTWTSPFMSTLPSIMFHNPACALVPWLPFLSQRGGLALP